MDLTHSNNLAIASSEIPWPTSFTKPRCDKLPSSCDANRWRSELLPLVDRDKSKVVIFMIDTHRFFARELVQ